MEGWSAKDYIVVFGGSGGAISVLILVFKEIAARIDQRAARKDAKRKQHIAESIEMEKLHADTRERESDVVVANLWKIIEQKNAEIEKRDAKIALLEKECDGLEEIGKLARPTVNQIYGLLREMRNEIDAMNIIVLPDDETMIFAKRFGRVKALAAEIEGLLP